MTAILEDATICWGLNTRCSRLFIHATNVNQGGGRALVNALVADLDLGQRRNSVNVLHVTPAFYPATYFGGPIFSMLGLCDALALNGDVNLRVLTTDTTGPASIDRFKHAAFPEEFPGGYEVYYCHKIFGRDISIQMLRHLWAMVRWADVVHLTGVYSPPTIPTLLVCRLFGRPVVWSPRGALQRWEGTRRAWIKRLWESVCNFLICPGKVVLHVTSDSESKASCARMPKAGVALIPNGIELPELDMSRPWRPGGALRLLYLGRLDPIKGIENLLEAIAAPALADVQLVICGEGKDDFVAHLKALVSRLGLNARVSFAGHVSGTTKTDAFWGADVCVVPSFTENFGMVVAEALAHAVPVIVSKGAPWADVEKHGCGLWVENSPDELAEALAEIGKMDLAEMGKRGRAWMKSDFSWEISASHMRSLYAELAGG